MSRVIVTPLLLLYSPFGLILVLIRSLLLIYIFLASAILYNVSPIKRVVLRLMCSFLGFIVTSDGVARGSTSTPYVSNCATIFDHMVLSLLTNCVTPHRFMFSWALTWRQLNYDDADYSNRMYEVFHLQPEETPAGPHLPYLLRFNNAPFRLFETVQPVAISVSTSLPIHLSVHPIDWRCEIFWLLFTPIVRVHVSFLAPMGRDGAEPKAEEVFAESVRVAIARHLNKKTIDWDESKLVAATERTADQKTEIRDEGDEAATNNSNQTATPPPPQSQAAWRDPRVEQVLVVMPGVSVAAVEALLGQLMDVDSVIASLLDQPPPPPSPASASSPPPAPQPAASPYVSPGALRLPASSFSRNTEERHRSFADRKATFLHNARQRYLELHHSSDRP